MEEDIEREGEEEGRERTNDCDIRVNLRGLKVSRGATQTEAHYFEWANR